MIVTFFLVSLFSSYSFIIVGMEHFNLQFLRVFSLNLFTVLTFAHCLVPFLEAAVGFTKRLGGD